jgi:protein TonB
MASPEEVATLPPETLPEDFGDWDSDASPVPSTGNSGEREPSKDAPSFGKTPKPLGQSTDRDAILESLLNMPRVTGSASSAPVFVKQQKSFVDWDNEESPATPPATRSDWEAWEASHSFGKSQKPLGQSADRNAILESLLDRPRVSGSASPAPFTFKPQKLTSELADVSPSSAAHTPDAGHSTDEVPVVPSSSNAVSGDETSNSPELTSGLKRESNETLFELFRLRNLDVKGKQKTEKKKWMTTPVICGCAILLLIVLTILLFHHGTKPAVKHPAQQPSKASDTLPMQNSPKPPASGPLTQDTAPATTEKQQATDHQPADDEQGAKPAKAQADMMNDQLAAPTQIPQGVKKPVADDGPPTANFGAAGADGLGGNGAMDGVLNGRGQHAARVATSGPLVVSSGVAAGMLIQKTPPVYPPIAKAAHVSGTVELHATISKSGTIKDLHVVSGPAMLQQAAVDAVRNWRYKPYRLNNVPTEIETTISVIFSLDR